MSKSIKNPGVFADLNKKSNDLLTKDYPDKPKVDWKPKSGESLSCDISLAKNQDGSIFGSLFPKYKYKKYGLTLGLGGLLDTKRAFKVEASVDDPLHGLKLTGTGHVADESLTLEGEYKRDYVTAAVSANVLSPKGTKLEGSLVGGHSSLGLAGGILAQYNTDKINKISTHITYSTNDTATNGYAHINPQDSSTQFGVAYYQIHSKGAFTADANYDPSKPQLPKITVGGSYNIDDKSTVKGKIDTLGKLGLSYSHKLNSNSRFVLGTSINTQNLSASGDHNLGFLLSFD